MVKDSAKTERLRRKLREADFSLSMKLLFSSQEEVDVAMMGRRALLDQLFESERRDRENHYA